MLKRTSAASYEIAYPSGSRYVYDLADGSTPKRIYLTAEYDPAGNGVFYNYDPASFRLLSVTDSAGGSVSIAYVSDVSTDPGFYKISKVTDRWNRCAQFAYNGSGHLWKITDTAGMVSQFTYGSGDFVSKLTTPYGDTAFVNGDSGNDRSLTVTDPGGGTQQVIFKYNMAPPDAGAAVPSAPGLLTNTAYQNYRTSYHWDRKAYMEGAGDYSKAHLMHWLHTADASAMTGILESEKAALESRVYYNYPGQTAAYLASTTGVNQPSRVARVLEDGSTQLAQADYNALGKVTRVIDPLGRTTTFQYDATNTDLLAVYQKNPAGQSLDPFGQSADLLAAGTCNAQHLPLTATDAAGKTTSYAYNSLGQVTSVTNAKGEAREFGYGSAGDSDSVGDGYYLKNVTTHLLGPGGADTPSVSRIRYDLFGRVWKVTDPAGYQLVLGYEAIGGDATKTLNRPVSVTYPDGTTTQSTYNRLDREWSKDRLNRWTHLYHDSLRHLVAVEDAAYHYTQYQWCMCGALEAILDPNGNATRFTRDAQGRVIKKTYADSSAVTYQYESATSRLKSVTDALGQVATCSYNADDTLNAVIYSNAVNPTPGVSYLYDPVYPRLSSVSSSNGTLNYGYNPVSQPPVLGAGMLASVSGPLASSAIGFTYDELGRVVGRTVNGASNASTLSYDSLGRVSALGNPLGAFGYYYVDTTPRLDHVLFPNSQQAQFLYYNNAGDQRLQEIKNLDPSSTVLSQFDYGFDAAGEITQWTQANSGVSSAQAYSLGYGGGGQLKSALKKNATTGAQTQVYAYGYDLAGNRTTEQAGGTVTGATYNLLNQLTAQSAGGPMLFTGTVSKPSVVTVGGSRANVDAGNNWQALAPVTPGSNAIALSATDASNHTTSKTINLTVTGGSGSFLYDLNGNLLSDGGKSYAWDACNRLIKITYGSGSVPTTEFTYDALGRRAKIVEKDAGGAVTSTRQFVWEGMTIAEERDASNNVTKRFFPPGEQITAGQPNAGSYFYTRDHLGSVRELTDATGAVQARYDYDPYGRRTKLSGSIDADFGFTGHYFHAQSGLHLTLNRAYDSGVGWWLSRDPIAEAGGVNLYGYVSGNPLRYTDPLGLCLGDYWDVEATKAYYGDVAANSENPWAAAAASLISPLYSFFGVDTAQNSGNTLGDTGASAADKVDAAGALALAMIPMIGEEAGAGRVFSAEKQALIDMAKADARKGVTIADMEAYQQLNRELPDPFPSNKVRLDPGHPTRGVHAQQPHGHVGPVDYIPIIP